MPRPARGRARKCKVLRQPLDGPHQPLRHDHPADPPAGHAMVLREGVDDHRIGLELQRGGGGRAVGEAMIDLVRDQRQAEAAGASAEIAEGIRHDHRARGIGRAHHEDAVQGSRFVSGLQQIGRGGEAILFAQHHGHRLDAERGEDVAIGRIARLRHADPVARIEQCHEGQRNPAEEPVVTTTCSGATVTPYRPR